MPINTSINTVNRRQSTPTVDNKTDTITHGTFFLVIICLFQFFQSAGQRHFDKLSTKYTNRFSRMPRYRDFVYIFKPIIRLC